jgi:hypothetical protein
MTDRLAALIAEAPGLARASHLTTTPIPVLPAFAGVLPERGLRPGSMLSVTGIGATSIALGLVAEASKTSWTACVGMPELGLAAGEELGVDLDHLVVVGDPKEQWTDVLAALVDAFDVVLAHPPATRITRKLSGRIRERDSVLVAIGDWPDSDVRLQGTSARWHGIGAGHGHLSARTIDVVVTGRRAAAQPKTTTLWLPDVTGEIRVANDATVTRLMRTGS